MRTLTFLIPSMFCFLLIPKAKANLNSPCLQTIAVSEKWSKVTSSTLNCVALSSEFRKASFVLCRQNNSELSEVYQTFLEYSRLIALAYERLGSSNDIESQKGAILELRKLQRMQMTYATEKGIWDVLLPLSAKYKSCAQ